MAKILLVFSNGRGRFLVRHLPVELSRLLNHFLKVDVGNCIYVEITGKRKRQVGLVVPVKFFARTKCGRTAKVLDEQLLKVKQHFSTLELKHRKKGLYRKFPIYRIKKGCLEHRKRVFILPSIK